MTLIIQVPSIVLVALLIVWSPLSTISTANRDWSVVGSANNEVIISGHAMEQGLQMNNEFTAADATETVITSVFILARGWQPI